MSDTFLQHLLLLLVSVRPPPTMNHLLLLRDRQSNVYIAVDGFGFNGVSLCKATSSISDMLSDTTTQSLSSMPSTKNSPDGGHVYLVVDGLGFAGVSLSKAKFAIFDLLADTTTQISKGLSSVPSTKCSPDDVHVYFSMDGFGFTGVSLSKATSVISDMLSDTTTEIKCSPDDGHVYLVVDGFGFAGVSLSKAKFAISDLLSDTTTETCKGLSSVPSNKCSPDDSHVYFSVDGFGFTGVSLSEAMFVISDLLSDTTTEASKGLSSVPSTKWSNDDGHVYFAGVGFGFTGVSLSNAKFVISDLISDTTTETSKGFSSAPSIKCSPDDGHIYFAVDGFGSNGMFLSKAKSVIFDVLSDTTIETCLSSMPSANCCPDQFGFCTKELEVFALNGSSDGGSVAAVPLSVALANPTEQLAFLSNGAPLMMKSAGLLGSQTS